MRVRVALEETSFAQDVGPGYAASLLGGSAVVSVRNQLGSRGEVFASGSALGDQKTSVAWSAALGVWRVTRRQILSAQAARSSRLPTLVERYLPVHDHNGLIIAGDSDVDPEHALELRAEWEQHARVLVNRVRVSWINAERHIEFRPRDVGGQTWRVAANGDASASMFFGEERVESEFFAGPLRTLATGAVMFSSGDRTEAFRSVPELQANASLLVGGEMFEATSALYLGGEYLHMGARTDYDGQSLPAFDVINLVLQARLIDAHLYLRYLNVLNEAYATYDGYLMTPRTFAYGIEWTLFN
jgi:outer membrane receptor protein involved in Fe transport